MKTSLIFIYLLALPVLSMAQDVSVEAQIGGAVMAAPKNLRANATVKGFNAEGKLVTLKKGTNILICLADDPNKKGFNSACYHKDLEQFMARSRELRAQGKNNGEIFKIKEQEVRAGKLKMPEIPTALHILSGPDGKYNPQTGKVDNVTYRYVVYIPYATEETTGLPLQPVVNGGPWLMDPGTHRAHIMISTPPAN
jgi:hypothetical protein